MSSKHTLFLFIALFVVGMAMTTENHTALAQFSNQTVNILPSGVSVAWETDSYTPPFYKGKMLYPDGGSVRFVALPEARFGAPENLFYTWKIGSEVLGSLSGLGRQVLERPGTILGGPQTVVVEVRESSGGPVLAAGAATVTPTPLLVRLYEHNPLLGTLFNKTVLGETTLTKDELTLEAHPYYFSGATRENLTYQWKINGQSSGALERVTLRAGEGAGSASVVLDVANPASILQSGAASLRVLF